MLTDIQHMATYKKCPSHSIITESEKSSKHEAVSLCWEIAPMTFLRILCLHCHILVNRQEQAILLYLINTNFWKIIETS